MYCSAAATLSIRSVCLMAVGMQVSSVVPCTAIGVLNGLGGREHDAVGRGDRHGGEKESDVDRGLRDQHLVRVVGRVDECLQQVDRAYPDDGGGQFDLEHTCVDVGQPLRLVGMLFE